MTLEVETMLLEKGIPYRLISLSGKAISHEDVKKHAQDADPESDCKTILTQDKQGNLHAFFLRGMMKIDFAKAKELVGKKISILGYEELKKLTGKEPGAVCPILLKNTTLYVDKRVFQHERIHFGSGALEFGLEMATKDLDKVMSFEIGDVAQE